MPASRIFRFARTSRCAIVGSATRKARAISVVVSPPTSRSVSATRASAASAGWQQVKTSARRSSGIELTSSSSAGSASSRASSSALRANVCSRRSRSIARLRAVVMIQAAGLSASPSRGQRSSAMAKASCTASSARWRSPRTRVRMATARPHSSRKTAPIAVNARSRASARRTRGRRPGCAPRSRSPRRGRRRREA